MQPTKSCRILGFNAGMLPQRLRLVLLLCLPLLDWSGAGAGVLLRKSVSSLLTNTRDHYHEPEKPVLTCVRSSGGGKGLE